MSQRPPKHAGAIYLALTALAAALLTYGSLMPLHLKAIPFHEAWHSFWDWNRLTTTRWGPSDFASNFAMFVPLSFFALGAWSGENSRRGRPAMALIIFLFGVAFSFFLEFIQVFTLGRVPSIMDIIAQTMGNAVGLACWLLFGGTLTQWVRTLWTERDSPLLIVRILQAYAALMVFFQLLPLNVTISLTQLWRKYRHGRINLIPFADYSNALWHAAVLKAIMYVPFGILMALWFRKLKRPVRSAIIGGAVFAAGLEALQVLVYARHASSTDILLGTLGSAVGGLIALWANRMACGREGTPARAAARHLVLGCVCLWFVLFAVTRWDHFPSLNPNMLERLIEGLTRAPLDIFRSVGPLEGLFRVTREFVMLLVLGLLARCAAGPGRAGLAVTLALWFAIELGALSFSRYLPDITLFMAAAAGFLVSVSMYQLVERNVCIAAAMLSDESETGGGG